MDTDISTHPKQGTVFRAFRGHVMGILTDFSDASFMTRCKLRPPKWVPEPVLMLPIPKDRVAIQEFVGDNAKEPELTAARPAAKVRFAVNVEVSVPPAEQNQWAPIKMVSGCAWSPGIYHALSLLDKTLDVAWERAFIHLSLSLFKLIISDYMNL